MRTDVMRLICNQQVQLEKIRASETEVRWQHEDDVDVCTNCQMSFLGSEAPGKPKHHCKHCGKVKKKFGTDHLASPSDLVVASETMDCKTEIWGMGEELLANGA